MSGLECFIRFKILLFFNITSVCLGLSQSIEGTINNERSEPLIGAHVQNMASKDHTHADELGKFQLDNVSIGDTLVFSYLGYESQRVVLQDLEFIYSIILKERSILLEEIVIKPSLSALNEIANINLQVNPVESSQEILQQVPGLWIGQHAGGGKAEQIFLRGFDIDHGTDILITVDGMPVNMVSHAHGQGYADLHFVIPETIEKIDFGKGPYYADRGNFTTAGYVDFSTKDVLENSILKFELGQFSSQRILGMFNLINNENDHAYFASEFIQFDGPFESSQNFNRINVYGKYLHKLGTTEFVELSLSHFTSQWDASGQIPQRAVDQGVISRFGAIDDTEGGNTQRSSVLLDYRKYIDQKTSLTSRIYYSLYNFDLFSNFTFFLEDPINADQIRQKENRNLFGINTEYIKTSSWAAWDFDWQIGLNLRNDLSNDNELSRTKNRKETLEKIQFGQIQETNLGLYYDATFKNKGWVLNAGIRFDHFGFNYRDELRIVYDPQRESKTIWSPKINVLFNYDLNTQFYLKTGRGFHSNDTRVVVGRQVGREILPAAYGADLGLIWKPIPNLYLNMAIWTLYLEQEFVYVGDAGIVEPSGETRRQGFDLSMRYQPVEWLFVDLDGNYTLARAVGTDIGESYIPLAPDLTIRGGITAKNDLGFYGNLNFRYMDNRPANEDNSIIAKGYHVIDLGLGYSRSRLDFSILIQNLFDTEWNETQFATESRLMNESLPVEEIHFTPGTPFYLKGVVQYRF